MRPFEQASLWNLCVARMVLRRRCRVCALITAAGLFFDQSDDRLRCPCHGASFSPTGQLLSHPGPTALAPLPRLEIRDVTGAVEVFGPAEPT